MELRTTGEPRPLPETTERAASRIAQEALTSMHKHAPGAQTESAVAYRDDTVCVSVRNYVPTEVRSGEEPASDGTPRLPSGGHGLTGLIGLIGLRERVRLAGGGGQTGTARRRLPGGSRTARALPRGDRRRARVRKHSRNRNPSQQRPEHAARPSRALPGGRAERLCPSQVFRTPALGRDRVTDTSHG
ncbi:hypothetical protein [Streptomyces cacaoi]|uniref:hypothetical protein n=1 Tax=Streptomyces cacaoi TaxID=1898 RepID=UPI001E2ACF6F|nr:hypothetical protein [Streptomyces cacaoi]